MATSFQVTFDCADRRAVAEFWKAVLGYVDPPTPPGFDSWEAFEASLPVESQGSSWACQDPNGIGPRLFFQRVPEAKTVKNRVHLDVNAGHGATDRRAAVRSHMSQLVAAGAKVVREMQEESGWWIVLTDPEGNEFCLQ